VGRLGLGLGLGSEPHVVDRLWSGMSGSIGPHVGAGGGLSPGVFSVGGLSPGVLSPGESSPGIVSLVDAHGFGRESGRLDSTHGDIYARYAWLKLNYTVFYARARARTFFCDTRRRLVARPYPIDRAIFKLITFLSAIKQRNTVVTYLLAPIINNSAFKKGMGCSHALSGNMLLSASLKEGIQLVNLCAIDLSKAFDKVNHYALLVKLMKRNLPVVLIDILEN